MDTETTSSHPAERATHYVFVSPKGRPFLSRMLCDLAANRRGRETASSDWARVTCPACRALGQDMVDVLLGLPDAALVSFGAVPKGQGR